MHAAFLYSIPLQFLIKLQDSLFSSSQIKEYLRNKKFVLLPSSSLKVKEFDSKRKGGREEYAETGDHHTSNTQKIMSESELMSQQLLYRHRVDTVTQPN